ncbi:MAG TPA: enoyl-CoA hydratase-related protein, partial [Pseudogracilibacillus sp.]|nr:enoyl-CoA hydratase-related protein [Pseudogracilibacillus sp.]
MEKKLVFHNVNDSIATIYLNNQPANALSTKVLSELERNVDEVIANDDVKVIVVTGEGKMFAAGADIKEFTEVFDNSLQGIE